MHYKEVTLSVSPEVPPSMTWRRLKEKLRAHGVPDWDDAFPDAITRSESQLQLAAWEGEGGCTTAAQTLGTIIGERQLCPPPFHMRHGVRLTQN